MAGLFAGARTMEAPAGRPAFQALGLCTSWCHQQYVSPWHGRCFMVGEGRRQAKLDKRMALQAWEGARWQRRLPTDTIPPPMPESPHRSTRICTSNWAGLYLSWVIEAAGAQPKAKEQMASGCLPGPAGTRGRHFVAAILYRAQAAWIGLVCPSLAYIDYTALHYSCFIWIWRGGGR